TPSHPRTPTLSLHDALPISVTAPAPPVAAPIALPPVPRTAEETGLPFSFVCDLILKVLYFNGSMLGRDIAHHICLPFSFVETARSEEHTSELQSPCNLVCRL